MFLQQLRSFTSEDRARERSVARRVYGMKYSGNCMLESAYERERGRARPTLVTILSKCPFQGTNQTPKERGTRVLFKSDLTVGPCARATRTFSTQLFPAPGTQPNVSRVPQKRTRQETTLFDRMATRVWIELGNRRALSLSLSPSPLPLVISSPRAQLHMMGMLRFKSVT